jgi:hypothetical protein
LIPSPKGLAEVLVVYSTTATGNHFLHAIPYFIPTFSTSRKCAKSINGWAVTKDEMGGHVARMGEKRNAYRILVGKPEERVHWEDQDICGWTISK